MSKKSKQHRQPPGKAAANFPNAEDPNAEPDAKLQEEKVAAGEPVALLGKTQEDAAKTAHAAGTIAEPEKPADVAEAEKPAESAAAAEQEATVTTQTDTSGEAQADADLDQQAKEPEPRTDHLDAEGTPVYQSEFMACLFLAMGGEGEPPEIENIELIPFELAAFYRGEPDTPDAAGLTHLNLKLNTVLLPDEDPRRVELAVKLFRAAIAGRDAIEREDGEKARVAAAAEQPLKSAKPDAGEGTFEHDDDRLTKSGTGEALERRAV